MSCGVFASILSSFVLFCPLSCPLFCPLSCPFALVFAFLFVLFAPAFISFPAFLACPLVLCLSSCLPCLFLCPCGVCVFFFPFGLYAKRKGAPCWCVLSCPVVVALVVIPSLQFFRLLLCTPSLQHCKPVQSSYTIRSRCHRSKQM